MRVLSLPSGVIENVETEEVDRVLSMVGEVFEIDEIDEHGCAWVTKYFTSEVRSRIRQAASFRSWLRA